MFSPMVAMALAMASATVLAARIMLVLQRFDIGVALFEGDQRDGLGQRLEFLVAGDEVGLGIDLDDNAFIAADGDGDEAFRRDAAGLLGGLRQALLAQPVDGGLDVALRLVERGLAVHHARAGLLAQILHHCGGDIRHGVRSFSVGAQRARCDEAALNCDARRAVKPAARPEVRAERASAGDEAARLGDPAVAGDAARELEIGIDLGDIGVGHGGDLPVVEDAVRRSAS
jgi:hypothetical protein